MFDYEKMIKRAIEFFPTWSDIRKRYKKSVGGKLLSTITDETVEIEKALQEYKDFYFLDRYEDFKIVDYCYKCNVGLIKDINLLSVEYNNELYSLSTDMDDFLKYDNLDNKFYYENGAIYIREEKYVSNDITVIYDTSSLDYKLIKTPIWNLYDEFACFIGIERQANETNEQLYNRMLYHNLNKPNSSVDGLKNAIITELLTLEPNISKEEIEIEKVNEANLRKAYDGFNELLDLLNKINKDVYRWKRWDLDFWEYKFENYSIEYLPYKWNEALVNWQNGIGYGDDLKTILSSDVNETDANVTLYKKDKETLLAYIRRKNIYKNIKLVFEAYNEKLNALNIKYIIKASPTKIIDPASVGMSIYEKALEKENANIQELYSIGKDVVKIENSKITDTYSYKLQFVPKDNNYNIEIYKCDVIYKNKTTKELVDIIMLLKECDGFVFNGFENLVSNSAKKIVNNISQMISTSYLANVSNGFTISNGHAIGQGAISVNGLSKNAVSYVAECPLSKLDHSYIQTENCLWQKDKLYLREDISSTKKVEIEVVANKLSFDIELNNNLLVYQYNYEKENYEPQEVSGPNATWTCEESLKPRKIKILITSLSKDKIVLSNFLYSKYEIDMSLNKGKFEIINGELILPNEIYNTLNITLKSYSSYAPIVKSVYIGRNVENVTYTTDIVRFKSNCERIFDIKCNCQVNLIKVDNVGNPIEVIHNYIPSASYKALSDNAYIRLDLDDWESVNDVTCESGSIDVTEESGKLYYTLKLRANEIVTYVTINGSKKMPMLMLTLHDIINQQIPDFNISKDKVYCSKLLNGIAIAISGTNSNIKTLEISKKMIERKNAYKYEFTNLPSDLNVIWGNKDGYISDSFSTENDFDFISFYPVNAQIHTATNEYSLILNEMKNIKIVNNFEPFLNTSQLNYYVVEPYTSDKENLQIKFHSDIDEGKSFDELFNWSIGAKSLYFKYDADLFNKNIYEVVEHTIQENVKLDSYIEIKDKYVLSNNNVLYTQKYKIIPPEGAEIIYKTYDGTQDTSELVIDEIINIDNYFAKLKYANIDKVFYVKEYYNSVDNEEYNNYSILKDEGIIIWNDYDFNNKKDLIVHIKYCVKKQIALSYGEDALYDIIPYTVDAYKELSTYVLKNMKNKQKYNLNNFSDFKDCDLVFVSCSEPSFEAQIENPFLIFNKYAEENKILIRTGYYYINGKEYYLFSNDGTLDIKTYRGMDYKNITFNNGEIQTYKATNNYVRNSTMLLRGMNNLYNYDHTSNLISGISSFNSLTACNSFNDWHNFGCIMKLVSSKNKNYINYGLNDIALEFEFKEEWGYAFIELTEYLHNVSYISFISYGIEVYLGIEERFEDVKFNRNIHIQLTDKINSLTEYELIKNKDIRYYLVVKQDKYSTYSNSIIDDIIISNSTHNVMSTHTKNIDLLDLNFEDFKNEYSTYRLKVSSNKDYTKYYAELCSDGYIRTTSNLDWGITTLRNYETKEDFSKCHLVNANVTNDYIKAPSNDSAYMTTEPIYLGDQYTVKRLFYKANNINIDIMKNLKISLYVSDDKFGTYKLQKQYNNNYDFAYGAELGKYVKFEIEIPNNKILDNFCVFAEYRSTKTNPLKISTQDTGYIVSNVFDTQECLKYKVKSINISDISNTNDIRIFIRAASDEYSADVWNSWKEIKIDSNLKVIDKVILDNARFVQLKIYLKTKISYIKFNYIDLEVI